MRWANGLGYATQFFGKAVQKYGWDNISHDVLFEGLSLEEANAKEIEMIKKYDTHNPENGYNCTDGGDGALGHRLSKEEREKTSNRMKAAWKKPEFRKHYEAHLREIAKSNVGKPRPQSATDKTRKALSIKVDQYSKAGEFIKTFDSMSEASRAFGAKCNSYIVSCCKGKKKSAYGFIWKYHGEELTQEELKERIQHKKRVVPIIMCDSDWNEIKRFDCAVDAEKETGITNKSIWNACNTGRRAGGYRWQYAD